MLGLLLVLIQGATAAHANYDEVVKQAVNLEHKYEIEAELLVAIAKVESAFNPKAIGRSHKEQGLMQLHPKYFPNAPMDIKNNMEIAAKHLKSFKKKCKKKFASAWFVCYNVGPNRKLKRPMEFAYYTKVMAAYEKEKTKQQVAYIRDRLRTLSGQSKIRYAQIP